MIRYQAKIYRDGKRYTVEFPDLPGCFSAADSIEEAEEHAREALSLYLEEARDEQWQVPQPKSRRGKQYQWISPHPGIAIPIMIRDARQRKGLSQNQLAKRLNMSVQQLQKLETPGKSNPTVRTLAAISEALDETIDIRLVA